MALFRCLFLTGLLFVDLTDDVVALVAPTPVDLSWTVTEPSLLLIERNRKRWLNEIEQPHQFWCPLPLEAWCLSPAESLLPDHRTGSPQMQDDCLQILMSLQC
jgi:hypothetical protein